MMPTVAERRDPGRGPGNDPHRGSGYLAHSCRIIDTHAGNIGGCRLCGNKNAMDLGHRRKAHWLKKRYAEGLRYKVLRSEEFGDIGMIEYAVGNHAWRPVEAEGYFVIHCLRVHGRSVPVCCQDGGEDRGGIEVAGA